MTFQTKNLISLCVAVFGVIIGCCIMADHGRAQLSTGIMLASTILWGCTLIASAIADKK